MSGPPGRDGIPPAARRYVLLLATLWPAAGVVAVAAVPGVPTVFGWVEVAGLAALEGLLLFYAMPIRWGQHRFVTSFTECAVFLGLLLVPGLGVFLALTAASISVSLLSRRPPVKVLFNAAQSGMATALGVAAFALVGRAGGPAPAAALVGMAVYGVSMDALLAPLLARLSGTRTWGVLRHRLLAGVALSLVGGAAVGLTALALGRLHPLALLALLPLLALLVHFARLRAHVDREIETHRHLAARAYALVGCSDDETLAQDILATSTRVIDAGKARLTLGDRTWTVAPDPPRAAASPGAEARISCATGERIGLLELWARPGKPAFSDLDRQLTKLVAAQAAHMFANAAALREVAQQRDTLARQERMSTLGTLVAGVAHEVNNPLTYLHGNLELAIDDLKHASADPEELLKLLGTAQRGVEQIGHIVRSLRSVARSSPTTERAPVALNGVAENVGALLRVGVASRVTLAVETDDADPVVVGRSTDLHQALLNLAKNALEAIGERPGRVTIRVRSDAHDAYVEVADDGPGIPSGVLDRLFDPFFTTKPDGTGLGLPIVQSVAKAHHGDIAVSSAPGAGATFVLRLPLERAAPLQTANPF